MRQIQMYSSHCTSRVHSVNDGIQEKKFIWEVWLKIAIVVVVMLLACPLEDVDQGWTPNRNRVKLLVETAPQSVIDWLSI